MAERDEVVVQLEEAALLVLSPPNVVSSERRTNAESVFHQMRQLSRPYPLCRKILETNCSSYVQFQSVITMKEALLREWVTIPLEERLALKTYLLNYISKQNSLPQYIQKHISVLLAILIKRGVLETEGGPAVLNSYLTDISQLVTDSLKIELGCSLLSVLLVEFSSSSGSSAIGMPIEFHVKCKKVLEENGGLLIIFTLAVQTLDRYVRTRVDDNKCITELLSLSLDVLTWDFRSTYFYRSQHILSSVNHVPFKPPSSFRDIILNRAILNLFIQLFSQHSDCSEIVHLSAQCLAQLASLSGPVLSSKDDSVLYLTAFLQLFIPVLTNGNSFSNDTLYAITSILRQLITNFSMHYFSLLSGDILQALIKTLTQCHQLCSQRIILLEREKEEEQLLLMEETHCFILETFVRLLEGNNSQINLYLKDSLLTLLSTYLSSKLNTPFGSKLYQTGTTLDLEIDEDDRTAYRDELSYIGTIARHLPQSSIIMLVDILRQCYMRCLELCQSLLLSSNSSRNGSIVSELESLYEDIHWIMLIATYTLTDVVESELSVIPDELLALSSQYGSPLSISAKELVLSSDISTLLSSVDPIVLLIVSICHWSIIERQLIDKGGIKELVSPQVCETAMWSMCTIFATYLITMTKYDQMSALLAALIVNNTDDSRWLLSFAFEKMTYNSTVWSAEEKLMLTSVKSLAKLTRSNKTRGLCLCNDESLWIFMRSFTSGQHPLSSLSLSIQREAIAALLSCASGDNKELFIKELLDPLCYRFHTQVNSLSKMGSTEERQILLLLESLDGVVTATHNTVVDFIFPVLCPILATCVQLMELFRSTTTSQDVSLAVLRLFCHVAENYTVFLNDNDVNKLYGLSLQLIGMYSKYHVGKYSNKLITDEDQCEDLIFIIQTLSHLTTKDYIDFGSQDSTPTVSPIDVVLTGLSVILPIIDEDILKFPELCKKFYELIHYICEIFPDSFCATLPQDLLHYSFKLIDLGCIKFSTDITLLCVECIEAVSKSTPATNADILINYTQYFLKQLLIRILNHYFESDLFTSFSAAIYQLMCSLKEHNIDLTSVLLTDATTTETIERLLTATGSILTGSREHKKQFKTCLMEMLPHLRSGK